MWAVSLSWSQQPLYLFRAMVVMISYPARICAASFSAIMITFGFRLINGISCKIDALTTGTPSIGSPGTPIDAVVQGYCSVLTPFARASLFSASELPMTGPGYISSSMRYSRGSVQASSLAIRKHFTIRCITCLWCYASTYRAENYLLSIWIASHQGGDNILRS